MLDAGAITTEAETRVGISDPEADLLRPNLDHLVAAINATADLALGSEASVGSSLVARTADRLEGLEWLGRHPEIADEVIADPVFLCGLPRSGTTFFQYLFDRDERFRLIRTWEVSEPSPPPGADPGSVRRRKAAEAERRKTHRISGFDAMHLSDADGPEECHAFLEQSYSSAGFHNLMNVPEYFDYLMSTDLTPAYRVHKRQLQLLQWRTPRPRWALKHPNHVIATDAILEVYPDARFVITHRDPVQILASISKMTLKLRESRSNSPVDPHLVGRQMLDFIQRHIDRIMTFSDSPDRTRATHVDYYRLVDDPITVMAEVHSALDLDSPPAVREAVADWYSRNPKGSRGSNPYALEDFGLDGDMVAEQFGDYMCRFGIPREQVGLGTDRSNV